MSRYGIIGAVIVVSVAGSAQALDKWFTGAVNTDWNEPNNWSPSPPTTADRPVIGDGTKNYNDVTAIIPNGTDVIGTGFEIGREANATLIIEAGASFTSQGGSLWVSYGGGTLYTNELYVYGSLNSPSGGGLHIAPHANAKVYFDANITVTFGGGGGMYVGMDYHMYPYESYNYTVMHEQDTVITIDGNRRGFVMGGLAEHDKLYQLNGGTITSLGLDGFQWFGYWQLGGTMEITADSEINVTNAAVFAMGVSGTVDEWDDYNTPAPVLKFTGTDTKLALNANVFFQVIDGLYYYYDSNDLIPDPNSKPLQLDVSDLKLSTPNTWFAIIEANAMTYGDLVSFVPGTDTNRWQLRVDDANNAKVEVKDLLKRGDMDLDDAGTADDINPFVMALTDPNAYIAQYGIDPNVVGDVDLSCKLDTDDITPFVAFITGGSQAIPEPASLAVLVMGGAVFIRRRRRK